MLNIDIFVVKQGKIAPKTAQNSRNECLNRVPILSRRNRGLLLRLERRPEDLFAHAGAKDELPQDR
jgi:hypothetical protein